MGLFKRGPKPGDTYHGPVCYSTDYQLVPKSGFYATSEDGKSLRDPLLRLVCVDDGPGDPSNGAHHFIVARERDPIQMSAPTVELEADVEGASEVST